MALSAYGNLGTQKFTDVDLDNSVSQLLAAGATLFGLEVNNSQNSVDVFVKIWDKASAVTVGTTAPRFIFRVPAGEILPFPTYGNGDGYVLTNGLAVACVTAGGTAGTTSPDNAVTASFWTN